jgi:hypothetical protein
VENAAINQFGIEPIEPCPKRRSFQDLPRRLIGQLPADIEHNT